MTRKDLNILHVDMDAFYAAVEELDDKSLRSSPVIVGGLSEHGVVTTANYEARRYGVHSAMPAFMARSLCPFGFYIRPRMERYREISREIFEILGQFTDKIEQVSVDEAYLDLSGLKEEPEELALEIKKRVREEIGLTMSMGLSYNKFLAKLASDWNKPDGFKIISEDMLPDILMDLPIGKVHGIGRKSQARLNRIGVFKVRELYQLDKDFLYDMFGKAGYEIYDRIRGVDLRELDVRRERKSIGIERTFNEETADEEVLKGYLSEFSEELSYELELKGKLAKTIVLKVKDEDFKSLTRSRTLSNYIESREDIEDIALELFEELKIDRKIRLLGITASNLLDSDLRQLSLFDY